MIQVYKASAGSGKTYTLAHLYIKLLLDSWEQDKEIYRKILAVTFTNKATAEMKERILEYLYEEGKKDARVKELLTAILHDYSSFSISTIDRFFQQTLRAFSRELGRGASYQIELDRESLIRESMDRILDSMTQDDKDLLSWLEAAMTDALSEGRRFSADDGLYEMGNLLKSEEHRALAEKMGLDDKVIFSATRLSSLREECRRMIYGFNEKVVSEAKAIDAASLSPREYGWLEPYLAPRPGEVLEVPKATLLKKVAGSGFADLWESREYRSYLTAGIIRSMVFTLGFAGKFYETFDDLLKEKNVMCLDESNAILRDIIDGSDAPFIYERLGVRYNHFLLDEFQDTSIVQWENFLPLLRESEAVSAPETLTDLIVGDVKQSIYRWRNSDWTLLDKTVPQEFPSAKIDPLDTNWRSARRIVAFNNDFYRFASAHLGLSEVYADVEQKAVSGEEGCVRVSFCEDQCAAVVDSVKDARGRGALFGDIAILVRDHNVGAKVADALLSAGIPVISDDSLKITASVTVRRMLSILHSIENPADTLDSYIRKSIGIELPETYSSISDLCEGIARSLKSLDPEFFKGEILFVQTFLDEVRDWTSVNGNNLKRLLEHIDSKSICIVSPESTDSVRVMTIHKSKGLEFPYVIFPFADKVKPKTDVHWCHLDAASSSLPEVFDGIYPVTLKKETYGTWFEQAALDNDRMVSVDNLNLFYVSTTRAGKELHIISAPPSKEFRAKLAKSPACLSGAELTKLLYAFVSGMDEWRSGEPYDFSKMKRKSADGAERFPASFDSFPMNPDGRSARFVQSGEARDFFGPDGISRKAEDKYSGIALHGILSNVRTASDLDAAVNAALLEGSITPETLSRDRNLLSKRIASHPEWFSADVSVLNEVSIISSDGTFHRPDRILVNPDGSVLVIDYKFGNYRPEYEAQVRGYMDLCRELGYSKVSGCLWFVYTDDCLVVE
ncbi:MAG: UvrD-helicase domain-containing protein [Bacteroidales bacterium]|nr:UvrD-helicase domain-containing protein [Bacteroidales bacterium]